MVNNSININKMNNFLLSVIIERKKKPRPTSVFVYYCQSQNISSTHNIVKHNITIVTLFIRILRFLVTFVTRQHISRCSSNILSWSIRHIHTHPIPQVDLGVTFCFVFIFFFNCYSLLLPAQRRSRKISISLSFV